jgi:uncharacterized membrane protein YkgB
MNSSAPSIRERWERLDERAVRFMSAYAIHILRIALAVVFIWFGLLKVIGRTPVAELVASTVPWLPSDFFVPFLGIWEMVVGLGLLFNFALRLTLILFWLQMAGTFLVLVVQPDIAFQNGNPLLLTVEGEFVIKNLVLVAAGLVIGSTLRRRE